MGNDVSFFTDGLQSSSILQVQGGHQGSDLNDFISQMSDDTLVKILSFLPIKDAVVTSSLSRRWQFVWCYMIRLNFDGREMFDKMSKEDCRVFGSPPYEKYIKLVNTVIQSYNHPMVQDFRICFYLNNRDKGVIDEWVWFAVNKKVEFLELDLMGNCDKICYFGFNYDFPLRLSSIVSLKQLILKHVNLSVEVLERFLTNSPNLEMVSIHDSRYLKHIRVGGRALKLAHFEIVECESVETIYVYDFDLVSFTYKGQPIDLRLVNLPKLKEVDIGQGFLEFYNDVFDQIAFCSSSLQALSLSIYCPMKHVKLDSLLELPNVKKLRLTMGGRKDNCLEALVSITNACPNLEIFTVEILGFSTRCRWHASSRSLRHLKLLKIIGNDLLRDSALETIKKIVIDTCSQARVVFFERRTDAPIKPTIKSRSMFTTGLEPTTT